MAGLRLGEGVRLAGEPFGEGEGGAVHDSRGGVVVESGRILAVGAAEDLRARFPGAAVTDYGRGLISAGFVDAHVHYPQTGIIASWGKRLIDWLNSYTFPEEMRFADPAYARTVADRYCDLTLPHGTTSFCSHATIHPASAEALFTAPQPPRPSLRTG